MIAPVLAFARHPVARRVAAVFGFALLALALLVVWRKRVAFEEAAAALTAASPATIALLLGAVLANLALTGLLFSVLMRPHGRVGIMEMQALIAAATLVNYLPLRPGLFGRVAYHHAVNGIAPLRSGRVIVEAMLLSSALALLLAGAAAAARWGGLPLWTMALLPAPLLGAAALHPTARRLALAGLLRWLDVLVWAVRYAAAFALIGAPIDASAALALACVSIVAMLVPLASNGLGIREWAIGLFAPFIGAASLELAITADLVNRAAEMAVVMIVGIAAIAWVTKRLKAR